MRREAYYLATGTTVENQYQSVIDLSRVAAILRRRVASSGTGRGLMAGASPPAPA